MPIYSSANNPKADKPQPKKHQEIGVSSNSTTNKQSSSGTFFSNLWHRFIRVLQNLTSTKTKTQDNLVQPSPSPVAADWQPPQQERTTDIKDKLAGIIGKIKNQQEGTSHSKDDKQFTSPNDGNKSTEEKIRSQLETLNSQKSNSEIITFGSQYLVDTNAANGKTIDPKLSYQQRVYVYAGTACKLIDLLESSTNKEELKNKIFKLATNHAEQDVQGKSYKKAIADFTGQLCQLLVKNGLQEESKTAADFNQVARWLTKLEHFYTASLPTPDMISEVEIDGKIFYHVTEYLSSITPAIKSEFESINTENKPAWFKSLTPPEQKFLSELVEQPNWEDQLRFIPSTLDRTPGNRNRRATHLFQLVDSELKLINTTYASGSIVPNGIQDSKERARITTINTDATVKNLGKSAFFGNLMTRLGFVEKLLNRLRGSVNDTLMIDEQQTALARAYKESGIVQTNLPTNKLNLLVSNKSWGVIKQLFRTAVTASEDKTAGKDNKGFINGLIENLNAIQKLPPLVNSAVIAFEAAYAGLLAEKCNQNIHFNCKSGKDRTGYVVALTQTIAAYYATYNTVPDINKLLKGEKDTCKNFAKLFCPIYVQLAKAAGNNSPGCDDLKLGTIAMPTFLKEALQKFNFYNRGLADMNRPKPDKNAVLVMDESPKQATQQSAARDKHEEPHSSYDRMLVKLVGKSYHEIVQNQEAKVLYQANDYMQELLAEKVDQNTFETKFNAVAGLFAKSLAAEKIAEDLNKMKLEDNSVKNEVPEEESSDFEPGAPSPHI